MEDIELFLVVESDLACWRVDWGGITAVTVVVVNEFVVVNDCIVVYNPRQLLQWIRCFLPLFLIYNNHSFVKSASCIHCKKRFKATKVPRCYPSLQAVLFTAIAMSSVHTSDGTQTALRPTRQSLEATTGLDAGTAFVEQRQTQFKSIFTWFAGKSDVLRGTDMNSCKRISTCCCSTHFNGSWCQWQSRQAKSLQLRWEKQIDSKQSPSDRHLGN